MDIFRIILLGFIFLFSIGSLLSYINKPYWFIRIFDFPLLTNTIIAFLLCGVYYFVFQDLFTGWNIAVTVGLALSVAASALKLYRFFPWVEDSALPPETDDADRRLSIMNVNVRQKNKKSDKLEEVVREWEPDILLLHETNQRWDEQTRWLEDIYPYHIRQPQENTYGMLMYSKFELTDYKVEDLCEDGVPSIRTDVTLTNGDKFKFYGIHPKPPEVGSHTNKRDQEIVLVGKMIGEDEGPTVVSGDFNDVPWSKAVDLFRSLSNMVDPRRGRGFYNTFNAKIPIFRYPLDFINFTGHFRLAAFKRGPYVHSDHFPLYAELSFEPENFYDNKYSRIKEKLKDAKEIIEGKERTVLPDSLRIPNTDEL